MKYKDEFTRFGSRENVFITNLVNKYNITRAHAKRTYNMYNKKYGMALKLVGGKNTALRKQQKQEIMEQLAKLGDDIKVAHPAHGKMLLLESAKNYKTNLTWNFLQSIGFTPLEIKYLYDNNLLEEEK